MHHIHSRCFTHLSAAAVASLALAAPAAADVDSTTIDVPANGTLVSGGTTPISTSDVLTAGVTYQAVTRGTYSPWPVSLWPEKGPYHATCGVPEANPLFPSADVANGPVSNDPLFEFAALRRGGACDGRRYPVKAAGLQISTGGAFARPTYDSVGTTPSADHSYRFSVVGTGQPFKARIVDSTTSDNYGVLRVSLSREAAPATPQTVSASSGAGTPVAPAATAPRPPVVKGVSTRVCGSRRVLTVHVRRKYFKSKSISARLVGPNKTNRRLKPKFGKTYASFQVKFNGLLRSRYGVRINYVKANGRKATRTRRFYTCTPKRAPTSKPVRY